MLPHWKSNYLIRFWLDVLCLFGVLLITKSYISSKNASFIFTIDDFKFFVYSCTSWYIISKSVNMYDDFRSRSFAYEIVPILKTIVIHAILVIVYVFYYFKSDEYPRTFTTIHLLCILLIIPIQKFIHRRVRRNALRKGYNTKNVLVVGAGDLGMKFHKMLEDFPHFGYRIIGFVDDNKNIDFQKLYKGSINELDNILTDTKLIDDVIITLPNEAKEAISSVVSICERHTKRVRIIPDYYRFGTANIRSSNFGSFPIITIRSLPLDDAENQLFKRLFDIIFSSLLIFFVFSWLFPIVAIIIKLTSKGSVFFTQERWGLNNEKITCYKFRSMSESSKNVDENGKYIQAIKNDPRITPIGAFLRKTNLDELPQFINVFIGNMSVVGPRPHPIPLNLESKDNVTNYMLRHLVKPGITGWAQVHGYRGETREPGLMQKRVELDIWYIEHWSFWLDCQIIFQTVMNMFIGEKNAY